MSGYKIATDEIIEIKDDLIDVLEGETSETGIHALTCAMAEIIAQAAPSLESAMEAIASITLSLGATLHAFNEEKICPWNRKNMQ